METERANGRWVDPHAGRLSLGVFAQGWMVGPVRLAKRTREIYEAQLRLHILPEIDPAMPALGTVPVADLTPALVRQWYAPLVTRHSASVATKANTRLRQILTAAVQDEVNCPQPLSHRAGRGSVTTRPPLERSNRYRRIAKGLDAMAEEAGLWPSVPPACDKGPLGSGTPAQSPAPAVRPHHL